MKKASKMHFPLLHFLNPITRMFLLKSDLGLHPEKHFLHQMGKGLWRERRECSLCDDCLQYYG